MFNKRLLVILLVLALVVLAVPPTQRAKAAVEITFWHGLSGNNQKQTEALVEAFNTSQSDIKVTVQNKGNYNETLNATIAAMQQKQGPTIAQIFDLGTPLAIDSGFFTPLEDLLSPDQLKQIKEDVAAPVVSYFTINPGINFDIFHKFDRTL